MFSGGAIGYLRKRSKMSLIAGSLVGALYFYAASLMAATPEGNVWTDPTGRKVAVGASLLLFVAMAQRAIATSFAPVPTLVSIVGAASAGFFINH